MAKTYNTIGTFNAGDVLTAAEMNEIGENVNNYRVPPMVRAVPTDGVAYTSAANIAWTSVSSGAGGYDTDGMWDSGDNTKITIKTPGVYLVVFNWWITGTSVTNSQGYLKKNNSTNPYLANLQITAPTNTVGAGSMSYVGEFALNDYVQALVAMTGTGLAIQSAGNNTAQTAISATWLGQVS